MYPKVWHTKHCLVYFSWPLKKTYFELWFSCSSFSFLTFDWGALGPGHVCPYIAWISNKFRKKPCPCQIHCHSFHPSLFLLCPFLLSYVDHCFKSMSFSKFSVPRPREKQNLSKSISVILFITVVKVIHQTLLPTQSVQVRQQVLTPSANVFLFIHHYIKVTKIILN